MALQWPDRSFKLKVFCIRNEALVTVLDVTAHGLATVEEAFETGRFPSPIREFLDNGGQLQLARTRGNKVISWLETYPKAYATTDDENEERPQKMPKTGPFESVEWDADDFDLGPPPQFPPGTPSRIIHMNCQKTALQIKKREPVVAPSKNVPIVAEPPSVPQARSLLDTFFAPRLPPAKPAVSPSASRIQGHQGAVATYSWDTIGAPILAAAKRNDGKVALDAFYRDCPLAPLSSSLRGLVVERIVERYERLNSPDGAVQAAVITGRRKKNNTENDYQLQGQGTEVKSGMIQHVASHAAFKVVFVGIKKELHQRCLLVPVLGDFVEIYEFNSSVLPDPMPKAGSKKSWMASKYERDVNFAVSEILSKMGATCNLLGRVRYDDRNYNDLFAASIARGPIHDAYAASCPFHEVPNTRGIIIEEVVAEVLTDQLSDCKITHLGKLSPYDIKCEIKSKKFYISWLTSKFGESVSATVESYIGHLKFEVKSCTIHSISSGSGVFKLEFAKIQRCEFDKLYLGVCLPTSLEVFLYDGASGAWTKSGAKGEHLTYAAYGTDFGYLGQGAAPGSGKNKEKKRGNLVDLKTDWQEVWTVLKQKKMNECKHIASIRF